MKKTPFSISTAWFARSVALAAALLLLAATPAPSPSPSAVPAALQEETDDVDPVPTLNAFTLQSFYTNASYGPGDLKLGQIVPRADVLRIGQAFARISLPRYQWIENGRGPSNGMGDSQIAVLFSLPVSQVTRTGVGMLLYLPTASAPNMGIGSFGIGPAAGLIHFNRKARNATGFFFQSLFSFAGPSTRRTQSIVTLQPLFVQQLGGGWSLRSTDANWTYDLQRNSTFLPLSLGVAKLFPLGNEVLNVALADVVTVVHANAPTLPKNTWKLTFIIIDATDLVRLRGKLPASNRSAPSP